MGLWRSVFSMVVIALVAGLVWSATATAQIEFKLTASDATESGHFGFSVSTDGDYAIVAGRADDGPSAYIFFRSGTTWTVQAKLTALDAVGSEVFGESVSISGEYAIMGADQDDDNGSGSGSAYVFKRSGTTWTQQAKLTASDATAGDRFGHSVCISGDYVIVGAHGNDDGGSDSGSAYIFFRSGTTWTEQAKVIASDGAEGDSFGQSVSISGDDAIVGAFLKDGNGDNTGSAYVYSRSDTTWTETTKLTASDAAGAAQFGIQVSISGDDVIVGAFLDDDNGSDSGSAYIFSRSGATWSETAKLTASDGAPGDFFGYSVSIFDTSTVAAAGFSGSGHYAIVGAVALNQDSLNGSAYIFKRSDTTWSQTAKLTATDGAAKDRFGFSVSISGNHAIVGARDDDDDGESSGSAYIYYTIPLITFHAAALDMGSVPPGVTKVDSVFVTNQGTAELSVSAIAVSGTDAALFTATPSTLTVAGGDSAYVKVMFTPATAGNFSAALTFAHNAGGPVQVALTGSAPAPEVTLSLGTAFGAPENTVSIPVTMTNNNTEHPVGGLQFAVLLGDTVQAHFAGLKDTLSNAGFTVSTNTVGDSTRLIIFSTSGATIPPGTDIPLATLVYVLDPAAVLGSSIGLSTVNIEVADSLGLEIAATALDGELQIGIRGDVNLDGDVSILDLVKLVRVIIGKDASPQIGTTAYNIADANADGAINIVDVIFQINSVLGIAPKPIASGPTAPVIVSLDAVHTLSSGQKVVPVVFDANGLIAGAQFTFTFDPAMLTVGTPYLVGEARGLVTDSHVADGMMRAVVYGVRPGAGIKAGQVLYIPVTVRDGSPSLTLTDIILVNPSAQRVEVTPGETTVVVKDVSIPTSFALDDARPNPFNPSTTIAYEVPEQTHITLTVYNLLGQEVVRLVDQVQAAGRYEVAWHGVNSRGAGVASGVYLYRIVSGSGYMDTKRMTLLK